MVASRPVVPLGNPYRLEFSSYLRKWDVEMRGVGDSVRQRWEGMRSGEHARESFRVMDDR